MPYSPFDGIVLSTDAIRDLLPYRSMNTEFIFLNQDSLGFGIRFDVQQRGDIDQIHSIILEHTQHTFNCTLMIHRHHYQYPPTHNPHYYLFVSIKNNPQQDKTLEHCRQSIVARFKQNLIAHQCVTSTDFLIFLRALVSPDLTAATWPGLIDIKHKPFHHIIPNSGTRFHIAAHDLEIASPNTQGLFQRTQMTQYQFGAILDPYEFWSSIYPITSRLHCDWLMTVPLKTMHARVLLMTTARQTLVQRQKAENLYADRGLQLQPCDMPLYSFLSCLPFR